MVLGVGTQGEGTGTCSIVPPVAVTDPRVAPVVAAPVDSAPVPAQPVDTPVAAPLAPTPVAGPAQVTNPPPVTVGAQGHNILSPRRRTAIQKAYACMDTGILMLILLLPFASDHNVSESVRFTSALRDVVSSLRVACDYSHPYLWTKG